MRKKELFHKIRKEGYEFFESSPEMQTGLNVIAFSMDGVFVHDPYCCSKLYNISGIDNAKLFRQFLVETRNLDVSVQMQSRHQDTQNLWMACYVYDEDIKTVYHKFEQLEQKLDVMCSACKYSLSVLDFEERMQYTFSELIFGIGAIDKKDQDCPAVFFAEDRSWMQKLKIDNDYDFYSENMYRSYFKAPNRKNGYYKICYIFRVVNDLNSKKLELYSAAFSNDHIRSMGFTLAPVSDFGQSVRFQYTYLDYEASYARLRRKEDPRIDTLTHFSENGDSQEYLLFGAILVINGVDLDEVEDVYVQLKTKLEKTGIELRDIYGAELFGRYLAALPAGINIHTYPLRQAHKEQIKAVAFSLYSYKKSDVMPEIMEETENKEESGTNDTGWMNDIFV